MLVQPIVGAASWAGLASRRESQRYEIIAGERQCWHCQLQTPELAEIPAVIRDVPDEAAVSMALIENIQRGAT